MTDVDGPLQAFVYAHDAIREELDRLQEETAALDVGDPDEVAAVRDRFGFFEAYMGIHDDIEDAGLYPALEEYREGASDVFEWDHRRAETYFATFDEQLAAVENGDGDVSHDDLVATMASIRALIRAHATKEDELLLPLLDERLSVPEQAEITAKAGEVTPDDLTEDTTKFLMKRIDQDGREYMLGVYDQGMPDDVFEAVVGWTKSVVSDDEWEDLTERLSALP